MLNFLGSNPIQVVAGAITGFFGTTELSALAMLLWLFINSTEAWEKTNQKIKIEDIIILSIGVICLGVWSFNEIPGDRTGLTIVEIIKSMLLVLFFSSLVRLKKEKLLASVNGIGFGLWLFGSLTLLGSLATQPWQSGRDLIYDIFSGNIRAGSIYIGYLTSYSLLIFFLTRSKLVWLGIITTLVLGIHAQNRNCIGTGLVVLIYLIGCQIKNVQSKLKKGKVFLLSLGAIAVLILAGNALVESNLLEKIIARFSNLTNDPRITMYTAGYKLLAQGIIKNNFNDLLNTTEGIRMIFPNSPLNEPGWHNLILDSTRAMGWLGLIMSMVWLGGVILFTIKAAFNNKYRLTIAGMLETINLIVIMPVSLGGHHLLGSITLTILIITLHYQNNRTESSISHA